jgi:hypothetical protein
VFINTQAIACHGGFGIQFWRFLQMRGGLFEVPDFSKQQTQRIGSGRPQIRNGIIAG